MTCTVSSRKFLGHLSYGNGVPDVEIDSADSVTLVQMSLCH